MPFGEIVVSENQRLVAGRYGLGRVIGTGGVATVYSAEDYTLGRKVALKIVNPELAANSAFDTALLNEAQSASSLNHPNIVNILDAGEDTYLDETGTEHKRSFIVMERVEGLELHRLTTRGPLKTAEAVRVASELLSALDYAHNAGVIHRDIKPANIMYEPTEDQVKVTDFGIARITDSSKTKTGMVLGTPSYMSPEQLAGKKIDGRSDLFSLGVTLYQMCCGQLPFAGESMAQLMFKITNEAQTDIRTINPALPEKLLVVIERLLLKDAAKRYQRGSEVAADLRACLA